MKRGGGLRHGSIAATPQPNPQTRFRPCQVTILAWPGGRACRPALPREAGG